ncbi:uncharacterized protein LOC106167409 [Lingula anatina]|uniref:Uncharacterized protein LOC106167409 n=1 Tax=Lingula anatina TaxID=7574 RepID=A0A1S3IUP2_LINAN|nr:uncharacterized protein LOC106167409 [Lingula anatina]|eukprot:XP_013401651.1 uncharacterized protein LOC106167409 [Lingula anatina]
MEWILLLFSAVVCCHGGAVWDSWYNFDFIENAQFCPNVYPLFKYQHLSKRSTSSNWSQGTPATDGNATASGIYTHAHDNKADDSDPFLISRSHFSEDLDDDFDETNDSFDAGEEEDDNNEGEDSELPAINDPMENPDDFFYDDGEGSEESPRYRDMKKTPMLPTIELYKTKAKPLSKDDPYVNAAITRLPYTNITYVKDYKRKPVAIGSGTFAHVYLAKVAIGVQKKDAAVKVLLEYKPMQIFHEARLLEYLKDTGLFPDLYGVARNYIRGANSWALVQEYYADGETAWDFLHSRGNTYDVISPHNWLQLCLDAAEGMQKLHERHVLFNDFKSNNMLLAKEDGRYRMKLIDVGCSSYRTGHAFAKSTVEERKEMDFIAPEAHDGEKTTVASDIFSLGFFIYEVGDMTDLVKLLPLGKECLVEDPQERPSIQYIINSLKRIRQELDRETSLMFPRTPALPETNVPRSKVSSSLFNTNDTFVTTPVTRIPSNDITIILNTRGRPVEVGKGTFAYVYLAHLKASDGGDKKRVVVKVLKKPRVKQIIHELRMYEYINRSDLFPVTYGMAKVTVKEKVQWGLVQEYYGNGLTMWDLLYKKVYFDAQSWLAICLKMAEGLKAFHDKDVIFNDFKTDNILIQRLGKDHYGNPVLVDVGHTSYKQGFEYAESTDEERESMKYLSPEAHDGVATTVASDVFSLGYALYEVYDYAQLFVLKDLAEECMESAPEDRPSMDYVIDQLKVLLSMVKKTGDIFPASPNLPEPPFYDTKADVTDDGDPYMAAVIKRIPRSEISFERDQNGTVKLGDSTHAVVYRANYITKGKKRSVAVKIMTPPKYKQQVHEIRISNVLRGTGMFLKMFGMVRTNVTDGSQLEWGLVQENFADGFTLWDAISKIDKKQPISAELKKTWREICLHMAKTMKAVHSRDVLFNDFKASNILIVLKDDEDFELKYIDLGLASYKRGFEYAVSSEAERLSIPHLAPEAHDGYVTSTASDVYSLGYTIHHIATTIRDVNLMKTCITCVARKEEERPTVNDIINKIEKLIAKRK